MGNRRYGVYMLGIIFFAVGGCTLILVAARGDYTWQEFSVRTEAGLIYSNSTLAPLSDRMHTVTVWVSVPQQISVVRTCVSFMSLEELLAPFFCSNDLWIYNEFYITRPPVPAALVISLSGCGNTSVREGDLIVGEFVDCYPRGNREVRIVLWSGAVFSLVIMIPAILTAAWCLEAHASNCRCWCCHGRCFSKKASTGDSESIEMTEA
jgi:hypothetical protein